MADPSFVLDAIVDDVTADFADRGLSAVQVLGGEWELFKHAAGARVVFGLGDFAGTIGQAVTSRYAPGLTLDRGGGGVARSLGGASHDLLVWVGAPWSPAVPVAQRQRDARLRTWLLAVATLGAMWRSHGGAFPWRGGRWLNEDRAISTFGAGLTFTATFVLPIPDDADEMIRIVAAGATTSVDISGQQVAGGTVNTP